MTSNPKVHRGSTLRSTGPKTQSDPQGLKLRRDADKPTTRRKTFNVNVPPNGTGTRSGRLKDVGGSFSDTFNDIIANQAVRSLWLAHSDEDETAKQFDATAAALIGIKPKDELEGMLAAQIVAIHNAAMECFQCASLANQSFEGRRENLNLASKLAHSYAEMFAALDRHRGKGQQHVTVEHVHVHQGGQAIVGAVNPRGRGVSRKTEEQPHSKGITHETGLTMPRPDPERKAVPIPARKGKVSM